MNEADKIFMSEALELAKRAYEMGEVPVGAVVVKDGAVVGRGHNTCEKSARATAHAEVLAIEDACARLGGWRLDGCTLYVTVEPCPMCAGAIVNSRVSRVVFGCRDSVMGACGSVLNLNAYPLPSGFEIEYGVLGDESKALLGNFFKERRKNRK